MEHEGLLPCVHKCVVWLGNFLVMCLMADSSCFSERQDDSPSVPYSVP